MTRVELIRALSERFPRLSTSDAEMSVRILLGAMHSALTSGHRVEIRGFGAFQLNYRKPRVGRNPKTGERVQVHGKHVPCFRAGKELRESVSPNLVERAP